MSTDFLPERRHATVTIGEALKMVRELQGLTQSQLSKLTGIAQTAISAFENDRAEPGLKRIRVLADALNVHPAVIAFPSWSPGASRVKPVMRARPGGGGQRAPKVAPPAPAKRMKRRKKQASARAPRIVPA